MTGIAPTIPLRNGAQIPALGLGTYSLNGDAGAATISAAIRAGYRLLDTAENYRNEETVGAGIANSGIPRAELFVTTKFNREWHSVAGARQAFEASIAKLGLDYVDLLLIHWPNPDQDLYVDAVRGLKALLDDGLLRAIGTSNFKPAHLRRVIDETGIVPDVNQIQLSPYHPRTQDRAFAVDHGIVIESWSPIGGSGEELRSEPVITEIAEAKGKTPVQVILRWHYQLGLVSIPRSSKPERAKENLAIFDFELTDDEVVAIAALDRGDEGLADSDTQGH
jgi:2,5-diketo-D-gluconate reductase A